MNKDQYLQMINTQLREAKDNMELVEKSYRESKAKYDALLSSKESYIRWVMSNAVIKTR